MNSAFANNLSRFIKYGFRELGQRVLCKCHLFAYFLVVMSIVYAD